MEHTITTKIWTKEEIAEKLITDLKWLTRGILAIYNRQTYDEQQMLETKHHNGMGFSGADSRFLSAMAQNLQKGWNLSEKQIAVSRRMMKKYAGQLAKIANKKI